MEELVEALDNRSLLISLVNKESKYLKSTRSDLELALEATLAKYGWSEGEINFISTDEGNIEEVEARRTKTVQDMIGLRTSLREARREELRNIHSLLSLYDFSYTSDRFDVGRSGTKALKIEDNKQMGLSLQQLKGRDEQATKSNIENVDLKVVPRLNPADKRDKDLWQKYSGNIPESRAPADADALFAPHQASATGIVLYGKQKPAAWTKLGVTAMERAAKLKYDAFQSKGINGADASISISDFLKSLPSFHRVDENDIEYIVQRSYLKRTSDSQVICDEGDDEVVFIIRSGAVELVKSNAATVDQSLLVLEKGSVFPMQGAVETNTEESLATGDISRGSIFLSPAVARTNEYKAIGTVELICISKSALRGNDNVCDLIMSIVSAKHKKSADEISLEAHIEQFVAYTVTFSESKSLLSGASDNAGESVPVYVGKSQRNQRRSILSTSLEPFSDAAGDSGEPSAGTKKVFRRTSVIGAAIANSSAQRSTTLDSAKRALLLELLNTYSPELDFDGKPQ